MPWCARTSPGRAGGEPFRQGERVVRQPVGCGQPVDDPQRQRPAGVEPLAEQGQLGRALEPDNRRQQRRHAPIGAGPEMDVAAGEDRILGGDREIGGEH